LPREESQEYDILKGKLLYSFPLRENLEALNASKWILGFPLLVVLRI
jgi:hypothetical protein